MSLVLQLISSPWFWADIVLSMVGGIIVWWGLRVEKEAEKFLPPEDFKPGLFDDIIKRQKREVERGWRILMTGIVFEVVAAFGISIISGIEMANLEDEASQAEKDAAFANERASSNELAVAILTSNNLALQQRIGESSNRIVSLETFAARVHNKLMFPRGLVFDEKKFTADLIGRPKGTVAILVTSGVKTDDLLALKIGNALQAAGWVIVKSTRISDENLLQMPELWRGDKLITRDPFDFIHMSVERPKIGPNGEIALTNLFRMDTPERTLFVALGDSGVWETGSMQANTDLPAGTMRLILGAEQW
jgi:hypothetical protein